MTKKLNWKSIVGWGIAALVAGFIVYSNMQEQKALQNSGKRNVYAILPLSGAWAFSGKEEQEAMLKVYDKSIFNLIFIDSQSAPDKAITALQQKLLDEEKPVVISSATNIAGAVIPFIAAKNGFTIATFAVNTPEIQKQKNYQRISYGLKDNIGLQAQYMSKHYKNTVVLHSNDDFGFSSAAEFKKLYEQAGGKVIHSYDFEKSGADNRTLVLKVLRDNPESVFITSPASTGYINLIMELLSQEFKGKILTDIIFSQPYIYEHFKDQDGKVIFIASFPPISIGAEQGRDAVEAVQEIIKNNWEFTQDTFQNKLKKVNNVDFIENGDSFYHYSISTLKGGKVVPVESEEK